MPRISPKRGRDAEDGDEKRTPEVTPADPAIIAGWRPIPDQYGDLSKSTLTAEVRSGEPLVIDLK